MLLPTFISAALAATCTAKKLYVSSYNGNITTLSLTNTNNTFRLAQIQSTNQCQQNASWLTFSPKKDHLYCLDEGIVSPNGSLTTFLVNHDSGALTRLQNLTTLAAPVNSAIYTSPNGTQLLAVAHYASALTTWKLDPATGTLAPLQTFNWTLDKPGPKADRQAAPHPHQVLVDPTNKYLVVPDLGADQIRILYIDPQTLLLTPRPSTPVVPGSGPRHGRFHVSRKNETFYYLVTELSSTLTGYKATYIPQNGGLSLVPVANTSTYDSTITNSSTLFAGNAPAEVHISPNGKSLLVSNRNATFFNTLSSSSVNSTQNQTYKAKNTTMIPSDTISTFPLSSPSYTNSTTTGSFEFGQMTPAGGSFPRSFSQSDDGRFVAVGLQYSGRVVVYEFLEGSGEMGKMPVAVVEGLGNVTSVVWGR